MSSERLTARDWVAAGLSALTRTGFTALKADTLAKALGVSRGSFYWHFADVPAFHAAVLQRWQDIAMAQIIADVESATGDRLSALLNRVFHAENRLEWAMRSWALADEQAKQAVAAVDKERERYVRDLLIARGSSRRTSQTRARILYWAYLGYALSGHKHEAQLLRDVVAELLVLAEQRG